MTLSFHIITMKTNHTRLNDGLQIGSKGAFIDVLGALSIPICFWGLLGNATIFWLLCSKVKKTTFISYFLNMIVAEFIVAAYFLIGFSIFLTSLYVDMHFVRAMENVYSLSSNASLSFLTLMCFERYFMLFFPLYYKQYRPKVSTMIVCSIMWFWSFLVALFLYVACYPELLSILPPNSSLCDAALIFECTVQVLVFFPIMCLFAVSFFIRRAKQRTESRLDTTLVITVVISFICIFAFRILYFLGWWIFIFSNTFIFQLSLLFDCIKVCVSPLVYFFIGNRQKQKGPEPMYKLLERALSEKASKDTPSTS